MSPEGNMLSTASLRDTFRTRLRAIATEKLDYPVHMSIDEVEETIRILWEFVGHMGEDVGSQGYEFRLIERARHWAATLQAAMLAAIAAAGPELVRDVVDDTGT